MKYEFKKTKVDAKKQWAKEKMILNNCGIPELKHFFQRIRLENGKKIKKKYDNIRKEIKKLIELQEVLRVRPESKLGRPRRTFSDQHEIGSPSTTKYYNFLSFSCYFRDKTW
eukprot:UN29676